MDLGIEPAMLLVHRFCRSEPARFPIYSVEALTDNFHEND